MKIFNSSVFSDNKSTNKNKVNAHAPRIMARDSYVSSTRRVGVGKNSSSPDNRRRRRSSSPRRRSPVRSRNIGGVSRRGHRRSRSISYKSLICQ